MFSFGAKPATPAAPSLFGSAPSVAPASTSQSSGGFNFSTGNQATNSTFGSSAAPQATSSFAFGQQPTASAPPQGLISSFSSHPFQYIQQCYDKNSLNYRFRVLHLNFSSNTYHFRPIFTMSLMVVLLNIISASLRIFRKSCGLKFVMIILIQRNVFPSMPMALKT